MLEPIVAIHDLRFSGSCTFPHTAEDWLLLEVIASLTSSSSSLAPQRVLGALGCPVLPSTYEAPCLRRGSAGCAAVPIVSLSFASFTSVLAFALAFPFIALLACLVGVEAFL